MRESLKYALKVLRKSVVNFARDKCFLYCASLSFYTLFSLAPVVIISTRVASFFLDSQEVRDEIIHQFQSIIGQDGADGIRVLMEAMQGDDKGILSIILSFIILILMGTNIFVQIQNSFNAIFRLKPKSNKNFVKLLWDRVVSFGMILGLGFLLLISLIIDSVIVSVADYFLTEREQLSATLISISENIIVIIIIFFIMYSLYRFLADIKLPKKFLWKASLISTIMLVAGKFGLGWYLANGNFSNIAGASASIIVLMIWVFYSSCMLFFGAQLLKAQFEVSGTKMKAGRYATRIKHVEMDENEGS